MSKEAAVEIGHITRKRSNTDGQDVDEQYRPVMDQKSKREAVLILNDQDSYKFVPREIADEMVKTHKAIVITPKDGKQYVDGIRAAVGHFEGFKPGEMIQVHGKAVPPEDIGKFDAATLISDAEAAAKALGGRDGIAVVTSPEDIATFAGKSHQQRLNR